MFRPAHREPTGPTAPRLRRRSRNRAVLAGLVLLAVVSCSPKKVILPNLEPETTLFVQFDENDGTDHTVNHVVHLYWGGEDSDGFVAGFEFRLSGLDAPCPTGGCPWVFTAARDSVFTIPSPNGLVTPLFEVRAIDDAGARDATPAFQSFSFSNNAPIVSLLEPPRTIDSTYASLTLSWAALDPDGDANRLQFRVWLTGPDSTVRTTSERTFTIPSDDFRVGGQFVSGRLRTANVQAEDDGGRLGPVVSTTWFVRSPVPDPTQPARLLLVDDVPARNNPANGPIDALYAAAAARNLPAGTYTTLRLDSTQPFRSAKDVEQTLALYDAVVWYRGTTFLTTSVTTGMIRNFEDGIGAYLDAGGKFYFESLDAVEGENAPGVLSENFVSRYFGSDFLFKHPTDPGVFSADWGIQRTAIGSTTIPVILRSPMFVDSLKMNGIFPGLRGFAVRDTQNVALWARDSSLTTPVDYDVPVAISVPQPSGGRAFVMTLPIIAASGFPNSVPRFLDKIFNQFGLTMSMVRSAPRPGHARATPRSSPSN